MANTRYEALIVFAKQLVDVEFLMDIDAASDQDIGRWVARNQDTLESARFVLGPECEVPLRYDAAFFAEHCEHPGHLRGLARAFLAEVKLAASKNDFPQAAQAALDVFELANAARRGGLVVDMLVSNAIASCAVESLRKIRARIDGDVRRRVVRELLRLEAERESFAAIVARDAEWERTVGWEDSPADIPPFVPIDPEECGLPEDVQEFFHEAVREFVELPQVDRHQMQSDQDKMFLTLLRMLPIDLTLREYWSRMGAYPADLSAVTPQPLSELPLDPFTDESFVYRRTRPDAFVLYSTGPKMIDGGGKLGSWGSVNAGDADLCLDVRDFE